MTTWGLSTASLCPSQVINATGTLGCELAYSEHTAQKEMDGPFPGGRTVTKAGQQEGVKKTHLVAWEKLIGVDDSVKQMTCSCMLRPGEGVGDSHSGPDI